MGEWMCISVQCQTQCIHHSMLYLERRRKKKFQSKHSAIFFSLSFWLVLVHPLNVQKKLFNINVFWRNVNGNGESRRHLNFCERIFFDSANVWKTENEVESYSVTDVNLSFLFIQSSLLLGPRTITICISFSFFWRKTHFHHRIMRLQKQSWRKAYFAKHNWEGNREKPMEATAVWAVEWMNSWNGNSVENN